MTLTPVLILSHSPVELHVTLTPVLILSHLPVERHVTLTLVLILSHLPVERHVALTPGLIPVVAGGGLDLLARAGRGLDASSVASISVHVLGVAQVAWKLKPLSLTAVVNFMAVLLIEPVLASTVSVVTRVSVTSYAMHCGGF